MSIYNTHTVVQYKKYHSYYLYIPIVRIFLFLAVSSLNSDLPTMFSFSRSFEENFQSYTFEPGYNALDPVTNKRQRTDSFGRVLQIELNRVTSWSPLKLLLGERKVGEIPVNLSQTSSAWTPLLQQEGKVARILCETRSMHRDCILSSTVFSFVIFLRRA